MVEPMVTEPSTGNPPCRKFSLGFFLLLIFFFGYLLDFSFLFLSLDPPLTDPMETEATGEEGARGNTEDAAADEEEADADEPADEEAAKAAGAGAGEGSGDRTDGTGAAGAQGATPTADPSTADAAPGSKEPQPGAYLKASDGIFIKLPWASSSRAPVEGERSSTGKCLPPRG